MNKIVCVLIALVLLTCGCTSKDKNEVSKYDEAVKDLDMSDALKKAYKNSSMVMDDITLAIRSFNASQSEDDFQNLVGLFEKLDFSYSGEQLSGDAKKFCVEHKIRVDSVAKVVEGILEKELSVFGKNLVSEDDKLIEDVVEYPFYLPKGTMIRINFESSGAVNARLYNADSRETLRSWKGKDKIEDSIVVKNGAIYVWEIEPKGSQYITVNLNRVCKTVDDYKKHYSIRVEEQECSAKETGAKKVEAITINSVFEEPRKITLRSQGKAMFSGGDRTVVTMQIPANCTDVLYSLRISTSQDDESEDGQFCKKVNEKYRKIKFLGLPLYESHKTSSNIFRELLNASSPAREEEAYCNLYVFTNSNEAKKFMDRGVISTLKYNVDLSKQGTQSCTDRIPTKGIKTIYFGFENTRIRYSLYLWLESLATINRTEYVKKHYVLEK